MRTLIVTEFISLDGVVDSPGGGGPPPARGGVEGGGGFNKDAGAGP